MTCKGSVNAKSALTTGFHDLALLIGPIHSGPLTGDRNRHVLSFIFVCGLFADFSGVVRVLPS